MAHSSQMTDAKALPLADLYGSGMIVSPQTAAELTRSRIHSKDLCGHPDISILSTRLAQCRSHDPILFCPLIRVSKSLCKQ